jgi:hypothetical protein
MTSGSTLDIENHEEKTTTSKKNLGGPQQLPLQDNPRQNAILADRICLDHSVMNGHSKNHIA